MAFNNNKYINNPYYSEFIALSRYARWIEELQRRETWEETVHRYCTYWYDKGLIDGDTYLELFGSIYNLHVTPSMRCLMTAGPALDRDHVAGYNCSYVAVEKLITFDEILYILTCGTGVGFSVERQFINSLPTVGEFSYTPGYKVYEGYPNCPSEEISIYDERNNTILVQDSKIGWASAFRELIVNLYHGRTPRWDTSRVRPAGSPLKTFGGRASGPEPLEDLFRFTVEVLDQARGRRLTSVECHDIICKIADIVVVGGVRRSALISLSNLSDDRMRHAKSGQWWKTDPQRALANNSVAYTEKPEIGIFLKEWLSLYESCSGERGIFSRVASQQVARRNGRRDSDQAFGTNPCSEIILRSEQFCNLSEPVVRSDDSLDTLKWKVRIASILGTLQATRTDFRYLNSNWRKNTEEEALLGVSLTGIMDHSVLSGQEDKRFYGSVNAIYETEIKLERWLRELKDVSIDTNREWAARLGINPSAAITCVKPSGTVSQLVDSASGIHPRYSQYYIRTVRADKKDPLAKMMVDLGFPVEDDVTKPEHNYVFSFPMQAPEGSIMRDDLDALEQLELWKIYAEHWCEHKPSITVYVREDEWLKVGAWVYENFDIVSGVSFLPHTNHIYRQAPYQECTEEEYFKALDLMPKNIDWSNLFKYETENNTTVTHELACSNGVCEL